MAVNTPKKPRTRGKAAALGPAGQSIEATTNAINDALTGNQHLLIDRSEEAALVEELLSRRQEAASQEAVGPQATWPDDLPAKPTAPSALPDWLSEAQAGMLTEALRDPAIGLLQALQQTHPAEDINARCLVLAAEIEAQWRFLAVKLTDLDRLILRTTLDALLLLHGHDATFDVRRLGVARRLEARLMADYQVPANG